jgi:hypothetical protein
MTDIQEVELKRCPRCEETMPTSEFGVCRARKDGMNLYCLRCIREKVAIFRDGLRARGLPINRPRAIKKIAQPKRRARVTPQLDNPEQVLNAIRQGAHTLKEIKANLPRVAIDDITESIANLLLWDKKICTAEIDGTRMYFIGVPRKPMVPVREPRSHGVSNIYSSGLCYDAA